MNFKQFRTQQRVRHLQRVAGRLASRGLGAVGAPLRERRERVVGVAQLRGPGRDRAVVRSASSSRARATTTSRTSILYQFRARRATRCSAAASRSSTSASTTTAATRSQWRFNLNLANIGSMGNFPRRRPGQRGRRLPVKAARHRRRRLRRGPPARAAAARGAEDPRPRRRLAARQPRAALPRARGVRFVEADLDDPAAAAAVVEEARPDAHRAPGGAVERPAIVARSRRHAAHERARASCTCSTRCGVLASSRRCSSSAAPRSTVLPRRSCRSARTRAAAAGSRPTPSSKAAQGRARPALRPGGRHARRAARGPSTTRARVAARRSRRARSRARSPRSSVACAPPVLAGRQPRRRARLHRRARRRARLLACCSTRARPRARLYNVCSGRGRRIREVLDVLLRLSAAKVDVRVDPERLRPSDVPAQVGRPLAAAAGDRLGAAIPLEQSLCRSPRRLEAARGGRRRRHAVKVLLTGATGFLGSTVARRSPRAGTRCACSRGARATWPSCRRTARRRSAT